MPTTYKIRHRATDKNSSDTPGFKYKLIDENTNFNDIDPEDKNRIIKRIKDVNIDLKMVLFNRKRALLFSMRYGILGLLMLFVGIWIWGQPWSNSFFVVLSIFLIMLGAALSPLALTPIWKNRKATAVMRRQKYRLDEHLSQHHISYDLEITIHKIKNSQELNVHASIEVKHDGRTI